MLIRKYERDTAQNLVFGRFTRDKRMKQEQQSKQLATQSAGNLDLKTTGGGLVVTKNAPISSSITAIQENYGESMAVAVSKPQQYSVKKLNSS